MFQKGNNYGHKKYRNKKQCYMEMDKIQRVVENETKVDLNDPTRSRKNTYARAIYFKLCKDRTAHTLTEIGDTVDKDHTTVLHAVKNVWPELMAYNPDFAFTYNKIADNEALLSCEERYKLLKKDYLKLLTKKKKRCFI